MAGHEAGDRCLLARLRISGAVLCAFVAYIGAALPLPFTISVLVHSTALGANVQNIRKILHD
jgi:hypothetical protein